MRRLIMRRRAATRRRDPRIRANCGITCWAAPPAQPGRLAAKGARDCRRYGRAQTAKTTRQPADAAAIAGAARVRPRPRPRPRTSAPAAPRISSTRSTGRRPRPALARRPALPRLRVAGGGVYAQEVVDRFDEALDRGTEAAARATSPAHPGEHGGAGRALRRRARGRPDPPRGLLGAAARARLLRVALDDPVGDQRQQLAPLRIDAGARVERSPSPRSTRSRAPARGPASRPRSPRSGRRPPRPPPGQGAQVERAERRVALAGEDQRQGHRAVEQVGAARLAGALRRARRRRGRRRAAGRRARSRARTSASAAASPPGRGRRRSGTRTRTAARSSAGSARGSARR